MWNVAYIEAKKRKKEKKKKKGNEGKKNESKENNKLSSKGQFALYNTACTHRRSARIILFLL
jgi:hypothetical protein